MSRIIAIIWTYNPNIELFKKVLFNTSINVDEVYIVDNGSSNYSEIKNIVRKHINTKLFGLSKNLGAEALNFGIKMALTKNPQWILILDCDTVLERDAVKEVLDKFERLPIDLKKKVSVISITDMISLPIIFRNWIHSNKAYNKFILHYHPIIFSGSIIKNSIDIINIRIDRSLFLDHADTDFFERIRRSGLITLLYTKKLMTHRLGIPVNKTIKLGWINFNRTTTPSRFYYLVRNSIYLLLRRRLNIICMICCFMSYLPILIIINPRETLKLLLIGIMHGFLGRLGFFDTCYKKT